MDSKSADIAHSWTVHLTLHFGQILAAKAESPDTVILPKNVSKNSERCIHPDIVPAYRILRNLELSTGHWADLLAIILRCKSTPEDKIPIVFKNVFQTLTGRFVGEDIFRCLPYEDKQLWYDKYARRDEFFSGTNTLKQYETMCKTPITQLRQYCKEKGIKIPDLEDKHCKEFTPYKFVEISSSE